MSDKDPSQLSRRGFLRAGAMAGTFAATNPAANTAPVGMVARKIMDFPSLGTLRGLAQERLAVEDAVLKRMGPRFIERANRAIFRISPTSNGAWEYCREDVEFHRYLQHFFEAFQNPGVARAVITGKGDLPKLLGHYDALGCLPDPQQHIDMALEILRTPEGRKICELSQAIDAHPLLTTDHHAHRKACENAVSTHYKNGTFRDELCNQWQAQPKECAPEAEQAQKEPTQSAEQNAAFLRSHAYLSDDSRQAFDAMRRGGPEHADWREKSTKTHINPDKTR